MNTTATTLLKTTPKTSGATPLACAIANRIANLDGLSPHIDAEFLASIARAITSELSCFDSTSDLPRITAVDREIKCGHCTLTGLLNDGSTRRLFSFYVDELSFSDAELVGLTEDQAHQLHRDRDLAHLRS